MFAGVARPRPLVRVVAQARERRRRRLRLRCLCRARRDWTLSGLTRAGRLVLQATKAPPLDLASWPLTKQADATRDVCVIADPDDPRLTQFERSEFEKLGRRSELAIPLVIDERVVGLLDIFSSERRDFQREPRLRAQRRPAGRRRDRQRAAARTARELQPRPGHTRRLWSRLRREPRSRGGAAVDRHDHARGGGRRVLRHLRADEEGIRGLLSVDESGVDDEFPGAFYPNDECLAARIPFDSLGSAERRRRAERSPAVRRRTDRLRASWGYRAVLGLPLTTRKRDAWPGHALRPPRARVRSPRPARGTGPGGVAGDGQRLAVPQDGAERIALGGGQRGEHRLLVESHARRGAREDRPAADGGRRRQRLLRLQARSTTRSSCAWPPCDRRGPSPWLGQTGKLADWATSSASAVETRRPS